jgi:hypothetical protein
MERRCERRSAAGGRGINGRSEKRSDGICGWVVGGVLCTVSCVACCVVLCYVVLRVAGCGLCCALRVVMGSLEIPTAPRR